MLSLRCTEARLLAGRCTGRRNPAGRDSARHRLMESGRCGATDHSSATCAVEHLCGPSTR